MAKYRLHGTLTDQSEAVLPNRDFLIQRMQFPTTTAAGVVLGNELWLKTDATGQIPANVFLTPGLYRFECRVGSVRNVAYFTMPTEIAYLEDILVTEPETIQGRTALFLKFGEDTYEGKITGITTQGYPEISWEKSAEASETEAIYLRFGEQTYKGSISGVTSGGIPIIDWELNV